MGNAQELGADVLLGGAELPLVEPLAPLGSERLACDGRLEDPLPADREHVRHWHGLGWQRVRASDEDHAAGRSAVSG